MSVPKTYEGIGVVEKILGNNNYNVVITTDEGVEQTVLCHLSGKMRRFRINVIPGDEVTVEIPPPYDQGRITFRGKKEDRTTDAPGPKTKQPRKRPKGRGARR